MVTELDCTLHETLQVNRSKKKSANENILKTKYNPSAMTLGSLSIQVQLMLASSQAVS